MFEEVPYLTSTAHSLLAEAERRYGPRDQNFHFIGVYTSPVGPEIGFQLSHKLTFDLCEIRIRDTVPPFPNQALYQVAHEVIHLLDPNLNPPTIMLEEGLAVRFSLDTPHFTDPTHRQKSIEHLHTEPEAKNYNEALTLFDEFISIEPHGIRRLRAISPLHSITPELLKRAIPQLKAALVDRLCERRQMR